MPDKKIVLVAAAALLDRKKRVLVAQRPEGKAMAGLWEFPGGKIEAGEVPEYALMRELREELGIETRPCGMAPVGFASHTYPDFHLIMPLFAIRVWNGEPTPKEGQSLQWLAVQELYSLPMPDADKPLISQLEAML
ncbi:MAG TPA: 8-oxo-dGTP diphosphatase MutT [Alphaproteobacteria bacterium]|nr:8-oxo-dGTP diphosphatase MutT [Alphaproteobacteria bacterium]HNS45285.1 8-oxo-dGTP diphosphatase MutT [Alphaproteobacteria bacterium]